jgi:hypothetical protein
LDALSGLLDDPLAWCVLQELDQRFDVTGKPRDTLIHRHLIGRKRTEAMKNAAQSKSARGRGQKVPAIEIRHLKFSAFKTGPPEFIVRVSAAAVAINGGKISDRYHLCETRGGPVPDKWYRTLFSRPPKPLCRALFVR